MNAIDLSLIAEELKPKAPTAQAPAPPLPPTPFLELRESPPKRRQRGVFDELLASRPEVLLQDAQDHPEAYEDDTLLLLEELYQNVREIRDLTEAERRKLDEATVEFFSASPKTAAPINAPKRGFQIPPAIDVPQPPEDLPDPDVIDAFWWAD